MAFSLGKLAECQADEAVEALDTAYCERSGEQSYDTHGW